MGTGSGPARLPFGRVILQYLSRTRHCLAMSSRHFCSRRRKSQCFSTVRVAVIFAILFFVTYYAATLLLLEFPGFLDEPPSRPSANALSLQTRANEQLLLVEERAPVSRAAATPRGPSEEVGVGVNHCASAAPLRSGKPTDPGNIDSSNSGSG